jgi:hypothetical protein
VAVPLLTLARAAIGARRVLQIKEGYQEAARLYTGIIAPPGLTKSAAIQTSARPFYDEQNDLHTQWQQKLEQAHDEDDDKPKEQVLFVKNVTTEKLAEVLRDNPAGVVQIFDELAGWVTSMNQYKQRGGSDREFYLSAWSCDPLRYDRKSLAQPIYVPHPFLAITGAMPPDRLQELRGRCHDGFLDRILLSFPNPLAAMKEDWAQIPHSTFTHWNDAVKTLRHLKMDGGANGPQPHAVKLTDPQGRSAWEQFTQHLAEQINDPDLPPCLRGPWSKMRAYGARLALILHLLRWSANEADDQDVDGHSVQRAAKLVAYFQSHTRKAYNLLQADPAQANAERVLAWIKNNYQPDLTKRNIYQGVKGTFAKVADVTPPLQLLIQHGYLREQPRDPKQGPGRPASPVYDVHPTLDPHNSHNSQN